MCLLFSKANQILVHFLHGRLFIGVIFLGFVNITHAEQLKFDKVLSDDDYLLSYQWHDHQKQLQEITLTLPQKEIFDRYRNFGTYQNNLMHEYVNNALKRYFKQNPVSGLLLSFKEENGRYAIAIKGRNQQLIEDTYAKIEDLKQQFQQDYLAEKYYHQFITYDQIIGIKPDHARIANESVADFKAHKSMILKKASIKNIRKVSDYVLAFIQSIPYSTLESRITSSGAGFSPPLKLLWENQGDCDSKVTLTASLLRTLMPRIKMALIFIDNHALIGIDVAPNGDEMTIVHDGITYVLAEPTGPASLPLGEISEQSELAINNGHYSVEPFHALSSTELDDTEDPDEIINE